MGVGRTGVDDFFSHPTGAVDLVDRDTLRRRGVAVARDFGSRRPTTPS